jgi:hypothetical protein
MPEGGFLIKFNGKEKYRCYTCKFDYDEFSYEINEGRKNSIPRKTKKIEIKIESN